MNTRTALAVTMLLALCSIAAADKIVTDPNVPKPAAVEAPAPKDERLDQKVTYSHVGTRLHAVIDDLTAQTGVRIRCGKSEKDWQTRDLPVTVIVKDITLGKLLQALADATHCVVHHERSDPDRPLTYRIVRDEQLLADVEAFSRRDKELKMAHASWTWDALARLGSLPVGAVKAPNGKPEIAKELPRTLAIARILHELGDDGKKRVFSGEPILLCEKTFKNSSLLHDLYLTTESTSGWSGSISVQDFPKCHARIWADPNGPLGNVCGMQVSLVTEGNGLGADGSFYMPDWITECVEDKSGYEPPNETVKYIPTPDTRPKGLRPIYKLDAYAAYMSRIFPNDQVYKAQKQGKPDEWNEPTLARMVKVELPEGASQLHAKNVFAVWPKLTDLNLVCEDFVYHQPVRYWGGLKDQAGREMTFGELLMRMEGYLWYLGLDDGIVVGRHFDWQRAHRNLMPEALLTTLKQKADTTGIEFDDCVPLIECTPDQYAEWITDSDDLNFIYVKVPDTPQGSIWRLYNELSPDQKLRAKSEDGLPISELDCDWVSKLIGPYRVDAGEMRTTHELDELLKQEEESSRLKARLTKMCDLVLRVRQMCDLVLRVRQQVRASLIYSASLENAKGDEDSVIKASGFGTLFPIYSPKRRAEVDNPK